MVIFLVISGSGLILFLILFRILIRLIELLVVIVFIDCGSVFGLSILIMVLIFLLFVNFRIF